MKRSKGAFASVFAPLLFLILNIPACDSNPTGSEKPPPGVLVPLAVSNYWAYQSSVFISGQPIEGLTDSLGTRIIGETAVTFAGQSLDVYIREFFNPETTNPISQAKWFDWNGSDGLYLLGGMSSTDTLVHKVLQLKFPVEVGESWQVPRLVFDLFDKKFVFDDTLAYTCVATDSTFETLTGTFQCYVYKFSRRPQEDVLEIWDHYFYYVPGKGLVGTEIRSQTFGGLKARSMLYDDHIN